MIEVTLYDFLKTKITDIPIYFEVPKVMPEQFYVLEKTGSNLDEHLWHSTFAVKSYSSSLYGAASLSEDVRDTILEEFVLEDSVAKVSLNSEYNFTDTSEKKYRYQAVFDIIHY